ncbi:helix-turn-helix domain-containing protein [Mesorhizobium xinjiangense]|uniref:helix-turn-helix domain-containing protein n=1 Tax=Mesorhizobium xinjiangense TaxID=2678685 RepID=UPI0018DD1636|nr:helix-turn-helix domain-containing protein [Mesorhizobium xinjiangense]
MMNSSSDFSRDILGEIEEVAGLNAALKLARLHGGTSVSIPHKCPDDHWLVDAVGREAADAICDHFAVGNTGARIIMPMGVEFSRHAKRMEIIKLIQQGHSADQIAKAAGVHVRTVYRHRANFKRRLKRLGIKAA